MRALVRTCALGELAAHCVALNLTAPPLAAPPVPSTSALTPRRELWLLLTLAGIQFTHILDFMIMMPLGPRFTQLFSISDAQFGLLVSAYTLSAGVSGLLASTYIDRFGRKRLLLVLYVLFGLATLACGVAPTYGTLMVARVLAGAFGGVLSALSQTIVADVIPFERRGRAMGIVMTSFSVSTVAGVPLGLLLAEVGGWNMPFIAIAAMVGLLAVLAARTMPAMTAHVQAASGRTALGGIGQVLADPNHRWAFLFSALLMFTGFTVIPYITIYMQANAGVRADQIPLAYLCGGIATLFTARWFGRWTDRWGKVMYEAIEGKPVVDALHAWLTAQRQKVPQGSATAKAIDYSLNAWNALTLHLDDGAVAIDNNLIERQIKPWKLGAKNWLFVGSELAGQRAAVVMSLVQSAKLNGLEPWAYLRDVLARIHSHPSNRLDELLPHRWQPSAT